MHAMNALASTPAINDDKPIKERRIPKRISEAVRLLVTGECATQKAAAERAGITPGHLCEVLKKPHVQVFIARSVRQTIASGAMRASARLNQLVDAVSEHVSLDASKHILAIEGIKPAHDAQLSVNVDIKAGFVIDITDPARGNNTGSKLIDG